MEKLISVLWKPEPSSDADFARSLRGCAQELQKRGAMRLRISVVDDDVAAGARLRLSPMEPPKSAIVGYWLHEADDRGPIEEVLSDVAERIVTVLVVESEPIRNTDQVAPLGERTPGFSLVTAIEPKPGLAYEDFVRHWHTVHRKAAIETQSTFAYVRNEIVRPLTEGAPPWVAIVEESFPQGALGDPAVFFAAEGDPEKFARHTKQMMESVTAFLALDRVDSHPMSEYVFER